MKKTILWLTVFLPFYISFGQIIQKTASEEAIYFGKQISELEIAPTGHIRCLTDEYEQYLQKQNPKRRTNQEFEAKIAQLIEQQNQLLQVSSQSGGIIYIPVVVHVIHNGDAYGSNENITDEQVESQITVMNQDYRRMMGTPGYNTNAVGTDIEIEFVLAKVDPNGNPTNGIDRVNLCQSGWTTTEINDYVKPTTIWDPNLYMNMWSVNFSGSGLLGYAQFPSNDNTSANTDGVVAGYRYFGSSSLASGNFQAPYDKGRTMTHEVGHFLGLLHTFQGGCAGENNTSGDYCADTPAVANPNYSCSPNNSCTTGGNDMIEKYIDYTNDACMNVFTLEQKARITAVMNNYPRRNTLKTSTKDIAISLFANDAEVFIENLCSVVTATCANPNPASVNKKISLYNRGTAVLTSAVLTYSINGNTYTYNYSGNLAPNKFAYITLPNTDTNGTLTVTVSSVNGATDQRASNDSATKDFGAVMATTTANSFTFDLIGDPWGTETTWELKNSSGVVLYSGGPYTDLNGAGNQTFESGMVWNLANDCYTFTIYDTYGDGMGGSSSGGVPNNDDGVWTISTSTGTILGTGGDDFGTEQSFSFSNAALNTDNFTNDAIALYPNPTKNILNISIPSEFGLNTSYEIYNNMGQIVRNGKESQHNFTIHTEQLSSGVYFIKLQIDETSKTMRFIKQ